MSKLIEGSEYKTQLHAQVAECIQNNLKNHTIQQLHNDGDPGRVWKCTNNGSSVYAFTVLAPPGWLIVTGDMGECMWSRHTDMLHFIRSSIESFSYFSEKASKDCKILETHGELAGEWLAKVQDEWEANHNRTMTDEEIDHLQDIRDAYGNYGEVSDLQRAIYESPLYNGDGIPSCQYYTYHYLWKIEALKWFVDRLDTGVFTLKQFEW
jgi:hypothetical protein